MDEGQDRSLDRVGALAGLATVALFVAIVIVIPQVPAQNHSIAEIGRKTAEHRTGILLGVYLGALLTGALLVFGSAFVARLRRAEGSGGGWWIVALTGIAGTAVGLTTDIILAALVRAVGHGVSGTALWVGYPAGPDGFVMAIPLAVFFVAAGLGGRASGVLPRWLGWLALVVAALFTIGAAGVTGDEVDGGILGSFLLLGFAGFLIWTVATSVHLWREPRKARAESREVTVLA